MSLEEALAANTAALEANTAIQEKVLAALQSGAKPTASTKAADKPATEKKTTTKKTTTTKKAPTEKDLLDVYGVYLGSATDKAEKSRLNDTIRPILDHFGAAKVSEIDAEHFAEAIELGKKLQAAFDEGGADAAEEVDLGLSNEDGDEDGDDVL